MSFNFDKIKNAYKTIVDSVPQENQEVRENTPHRATKALQFFLDGYNQNIQLIVNNALFETNNNEIIIVKDIEFYSLCEHHLIPFFGKCHVAYIPQKNIIGLSKISRIVDMFARRLQLQERLTEDIANQIQTILNPAGVGVIVEGSHMCLMMRGAQKQHASLITRKSTGIFSERKYMKRLEIAIQSR